MTYENPALRIRRESIQILLAMKKKNSDISDDKIIGLFAVQSGLKEKTIAEYVNLLKRAGLWDSG